MYHPSKKLLKKKLDSGQLTSLQNTDDGSFLNEGHDTENIQILDPVAEGLKLMQQDTISY